MKRLNGKKWTPWVEGRHLPIRGLLDPKLQVKMIKKHWKEAHR